MSQDRYTQSNKFVRDMMNHNIKQAIEDLMNLGYTDKEEIFKQVMSQFDVDMKTVKKIARKLCKEMCNKVRVLQSSLPDLCVIEQYGIQETKK